MEKIEEIEEVYKKDIEKIDNEYLSKIKIASNKKTVDEDYKKKLSLVRRNYEGKFKKYLIEQKKITLIEKEKKIHKKRNKINYKRLEVKKLDLKPNFKEKFSTKWELFRFNSRIKYNNLIRTIFPLFIRYHLLKIKVSLKNSYNDFYENILRILDSIKEKLISSASKTKNFFISIILKIKEIITKLFSLIKRIKFRKKKEEKEKSADEQLAEKILNQKS